MRCGIKQMFLGWAHETVLGAWCAAEDFEKRLGLPSHVSKCIDTVAAMIELPLSRIICPDLRLERRGNRILWNEQ